MLKQLLQSGQTLICPGTYDALSALIAREAGFKTLYMSGFAVAGTLLGKPDIGLLAASEMVERARQITSVAGATPLIADGDNGYGGEFNVERLVQQYEQAGVACIQLEDQVSPKRCGHMENKEVVSIEDATRKIARAVRSRGSSEFLIMARTDSRATHNLDEAIRRGNSFLDAGADILFIEAPRSVEEMQHIRTAFPDTPLVANMVEDGKTPELNSDELADLGYQIVLRPVSALLAVASTLQQCYSALAETGRLDPAQPRLTFQAFNTQVGLPRFIDEGKT